MNRIAVLSLVKRPDGKSQIEGWAGDIKFVVRRVDGANDQWALMASPSPASRPHAPNSPKPLSKSDRAAEAARDLLQRLGDPALDDDLSDIFPASWLKD